MPTPQVVIATDEIFPSARARIEEVAAVDGRERLAEADGLLCDFRTERIDAAFLDRAPRLRVIASASVGYDNVDVDECTRRGIPFANSRGSLTETVADMAYLHVLAAMRNVNLAQSWVRSGNWVNGDAPYGVDVFGKTLGIVGMGEIGAALARRARASGMRIVYHNRRRRPTAEEEGACYLGFEDLLESADCVVALVPLGAATRGLFGAEEFARMRPSAYFVNVARGAVVDTGALYEALRRKALAGAALDVVDPEPLPPDHPLLALPNVFVTPHVASATRETRERMTLLAAENIVAGLLRRPLPTIVNETAITSHLQKIARER